MHQCNGQRSPPAADRSSPIQQDPRSNRWGNLDMPPEHQGSADELSVGDAAERRTPSKDSASTRTAVRHDSPPPAASPHRSSRGGSFSIDSILSSDSKKSTSPLPSPPATTTKRDLPGSRDDPDSPPIKRTCYTPPNSRADLHGDVSALRHGEKSPLTSPGLHGRPEYSFAPITPTPHWYPWIQANTYLHYAYEGK